MVYITPITVFHVFIVVLTHKQQARVDGTIFFIEHSTLVSSHNCDVNLTTF